MAKAKGKPGQRVYGWVAAIAILAAAIWLAYPRERLLLQIAHPIVAIDAAGAENLWNSNTQVYWLTDSQLLIVVTDRAGEAGAVHWQGHADLLDVPTHKRTRLAVLAPLFNSQGARFMRPPDGFSLSPGGTWLRYRMLRDDGSLEYTEGAANLKTGQSRAWGRDEELLRSFWTDDHTFLEVGEVSVPGTDHNVELTKAVFTVHDANDPRHDHCYRPSAEESTSLLERFDTANPLRTDTHFTGYLALETTLAWYDNRSHGIVRRHDTVALPATSSLVDEGDTSIHGAAILHILRAEMPPILAWLSAVIPAVSAKPIVTQGLWLNRGGRKGIEEVGHIPLGTDQSEYTAFMLQQIQWLPSGKQISFIYRGTLYVVPAASAPVR